jgi:CO/xanthine dehydrogenase Mo-binding subunit
MLYAVTIRSPAARGRLVEIKTPRLPNSYTLVIPADIPGKNQLYDSPVRLLADKTVSYIGEPVAILTGPDELKVEEYARLCIVTVEEEKAGFSLDPQKSEALIKERDYSNIPRGQEITGALKESHTLITGKYSTSLQEHWYSEPHGAVAFFSEKKLTVHTSSQWTSHVKCSLAIALKMDKSNITIESTQPGITLDGKLWYPSLVSCHAALAALVTKKPVKLMLTRDEDFSYSPKRGRAEIYIQSGLGEKGKIEGTEIKALLDLGSQGVFTDEILDHTCLGCLGFYKLGKIKLEAKALKTNLPPMGPMAGMGLSQGAFAIERHVSRLADILREDPAEWRKRNCFTKKDSLAIGVPLKNSVPAPELIDTAAAMGDYYRKWASYELLRQRRRDTEWEIHSEPLRGIGVAVAYQSSGFLYTGTEKGVYSLEITLGKAGELEIRSSIECSGPNARIWREIAGEILSVEEEKIKIISSGDVPDSGPDSMSRKITVITHLVEKCCKAIRHQRFRDPLPITVRRQVKANKKIPWGGAQTNAQSGVPDGEKPADFNAFANPGWGAAIVEVEIDYVSLNPVPRGVWMAVDGGKILSQSRARRSLKTGIIQALSWAGREQVVYDEGMISGLTVRNYDIAAPIEIPAIHIDFLWNDTASPKGIGDLPFSCVPAAYAQAVSQAIDHPFEKIPINARDVLEALLLKKTEVNA